MEVEKIISIIKQLNFEEVIKQESKEYLNEGYKFIPYHEKDDDKKFITNGLKRFINKDDKIIFLLESINHLNEILEQVSIRLTYYENENQKNFSISVGDYEYLQSHNDLIIEKKNYEARIFYAVRELEKLGLKDLNNNAFTQEQSKDLTRKINALLIKIDELSAGQEVIYNFIDEFKTDLKELTTDFPLGKKRWHQRFSGIVATYFGNKGADAIYDLIKPEILKIIQNITIEKLLH